MGSVCAHTDTRRTQDECQYPWYFAIFLRSGTPNASAGCDPALDGQSQPFHWKPPRSILKGQRAATRDRRRPCVAIRDVDFRSHEFLGCHFSVWPVRSQSTDFPTSLPMANSTAEPGPCHFDGSVKFALDQACPRAPSLEAEKGPYCLVGYQATQPTCAMVRSRCYYHACEETTGWFQKTQAVGCGEEGDHLLLYRSRTDGDSKGSQAAENQHEQLRGVRRSKGSSPGNPLIPLPVSGKPLKVHLPQ